MRLLPGLLFAAAVWAQPPCAVQGTVTDKASGVPLAAARVFLTPQDQHRLPALLERSGRSGAFCFTTVEAGDYTLEVQRAGYLDEQYGKGLVLAIRTGVELAPLEVKLLRRAVLSGTVVDGDGEPLAGAAVAVYIRLASREGPEPDEVASQGTDDRGQFRFAGLKPGTYYLGAALHDGRNETTDMLFLDAGGKLRQEGHSQTFYSSAATFGDAKPILVEAGKEVSGMLLTMHKTELRHIAGKVAGNLENGYILVRFPNDDTRGEGISSDGSFLLNGLEPGAYVIEIRAGNQTRGRKEVDTTNGDVDGVTITANLQPLPAFALPVQFRTEGAGPAYRPTQRTFAFLQRSDGKEGSVAQATPEGGFRFTNLSPAVYKLSTFSWGEDEFYVKRILLGGREAAGSTLDLRGGDPGDLVIVMSPKSAIIQGKIATAAPLSQAVTILLVDEEGRQAGRAVADQTGAFHMDHLKPGKLRLYAVQDLASRQWSSDLAAALRERSMAIELKDGETKEVGPLNVITAEQLAAAEK